VTRVDANGTRLRLRALHAMGRGSARIAGAQGVRERNIQKVVKGNVRTVDAALLRAVRELYEAWWALHPPERTRADRAAATAARHRAAQDNWCTPVGLNDDQLDQPGYVPTCGYRPATGVGVATDREADCVAGGREFAEL